MSKLPKYQGKKGSSEIKPRRASFTSLPGMGMLSVIGREAQRQGLTNQYDIRNTMLNPKNWFPNDYSKLPTFDKAYQAARQQGEKEFIWKGKRYSGEYAGSPEEQLRQTGITNEQLQNKSWLDERLHRNLNPIGYGSIPGMLNRLSEAVIENEPSRARSISEDLAETGDRKKQNRLDAYYLYQGYPQRFNTFSISKYKPGRSEDKNATYYSINDDFGQAHLLHTINFTPEGKPYFNYEGEPVGSSGRPIKGFRVDKHNNVMGQYRLGLGEDEKGKYISYYDIWDLAPVDQKVNMDFGKPFEVYDRVYYKNVDGRAVPLDQQTIRPTMKIEKTTQFVPKKQSGGWLDEYDLPKYQGKTGSGQILQQRYGVGPMMGDLAQQSGVPSQAEIARQAQIRKEAAVREQQLAARARYEAMPKIGPARERNYSEQVQAEEQRRRLNQQYADQNPEVTTDESGNIVPSGYGRFMQTYGPNLDKFARSWETPLAIEGALSLAPLVGRGVAAGTRTAGEYLTTQTPLKNAYKYNPWAFKAKPTLAYRQVGKEAFEDLQNTGFIRGKGENILTDPDANLQQLIDYSNLVEKGSPNYAGAIGVDAPYFQKGKLFYKQGIPEAKYLIETKQMGHGVFSPAQSGFVFKGEGFYPSNAPGGIGVLVPNSFDRQIQNFNIYQQHWLKGYKPVQLPKSTQSITRGPINYWEEPGFAKRNPDFTHESHVSSAEGVGKNVLDLPDRLKPILMDEAGNPISMEDALIKPVPPRIPTAEELALSQRLKDRNARIIEALRNRKQKKQGGPLVNPNGYKDGRPSKGSNWRIPGNTVYNPTGETILAQANTGEQTILQPYDTNSVTFQDADYIDEYHLTDSQPNWLEDYKAKLGGPYNSSWMLTNPKPEPVYVPKMQQAGTVDTLTRILTPLVKKPKPKFKQKLVTRFQKFEDLDVNIPNIEFTDVRPAIAQPTFEQAKVDMSKPTKYSYTYPTFDKDVQKTMYFPDRSSWKTFVEQQRGASSQEGKDYGSATGKFATGGNLLSKSITCPNCGHSWKGADGGTDALTCHKCGSVVKMQNGGEKVMKGKEYVEQWMNSPMYKQMLEKSAQGPEFERINTGRISNLSIPTNVSTDMSLHNTGTLGQMQHRIRTMFNATVPEREEMIKILQAAVDNPKDKEAKRKADEVTQPKITGWNIGVNPKLKPGTLEYEATLAHEHGHTTDDPFVSKLPHQMSKKELMSQDLSPYIPKSDIEKMQSYYQGKVNDDLTKYVSKPQETRQYLTSLRYLGKTQGVYDPFTEKITPEQYRKIKPTELSDPAGMLRNIYTDEQIIDMLNSISRTQRANGVPVAQNGQEMKFYQEGLDFTPKTISKNGGWLREYQDAGPIIGDTFTPYSRNYLNNLRNEWVATYNKPIPYRIPTDDRFDEFYDEKVNTIPQYYKTIPAWVKGLGTDMEEYREGDKNIPPKFMGKLAKGYEWVENYRTGPFRDDSQIREYTRLIKSIRNAESRKPVWNRDVKFKSE